MFRFLDWFWDKFIAFGGRVIEIGCFLLLMAVFAVVVYVLYWLFFRG